MILKISQKKTLEVVKHIENLKNLNDQKKDNKVIDLKERKKFKRKTYNNKKKKFFKKAK